MSNDNNNIGNLLNTLEEIDLKKFINLKIALDIKSRTHDELMSGWGPSVGIVEDYCDITKTYSIVAIGNNVLEVQYYSDLNTPYTFRGEKIKSDLDVSKYYYIINYYLDMDQNIDSDEKAVILNTFKTNYMLSLLEDYNK